MQCDFKMCRIKHKMAAMALLLKIISYFVIGIEPLVNCVSFYRVDDHGKSRLSLIYPHVKPPSFVAKLIDLSWLAAIPTNGSLPLSSTSMLSGSEEEVLIVSYTTSLLVASCLSDRDMLKCMLNHPSIGNWLHSLIFVAHENRIREIVSKAIENLCVNCTFV
jgi:hypothetical protein